MKAPRMSELGRIATFTVVRETMSGLYLDAGPLGEVLLPGRLIPHGVRVGDRIDAFLHTDSLDRLVATTVRPRAQVGEFAYLRVKDLHERAGAFLDWGISKDLLLPYNEQGDRVRPGDFVLVKVLLDAETRRIYASALVNRHLARTRPPYAPGDAVELIIADESPLGYNAVVDHRYRGLLYHTNLAGRLAAGASMRGFVKQVREDGKIDLSLDEAGYARVEPLAQRILEELERVGGRLNFDDSSDPEAIRDRFGASKKAFKQALGALYRERRIRFTEPGIELAGGEG
jgi:predicted RNA-binding protein (virulence factor B family)